jgi:hypothetical protein
MGPAAKRSRGGNQELNITGGRGSAGASPYRALGRATLLRSRGLAKSDLRPRGTMVEKMYLQSQMGMVMCLDERTPCESGAAARPRAC